MKIEEILAAVNGKLVCLGNLKGKDFLKACSSDLMSDVLTLKEDKLVLITGLANIQTVRTAEMADISCIIVVRNKKVNQEMIRIADEAGIALIECPYSMFKASGLLFIAGLKPTY